MLNGTSLVPDFPLDRLAFRTEGLSGSDLKEVCRNAAMMPVREYMKKAERRSRALGEGQGRGEYDPSVEYAQFQPPPPFCFIDQVNFLLRMYNINRASNFVRSASKTSSPRTRRQCQSQDFMNIPECSTSHLVKRTWIDVPLL